ncbi:MAG: hypothetical protein CMP22_07870 [Rickettsiales bacterium]|nr:hypothetical protein [Rickettsiales bacterium]|tara:strand:- start:148 stop:723 length:576 start_codon:yes stop_codon:yes gene_type:complete
MQKQTLFNKAIQTLARKVRLIAQRGVVSLINDSKKLQQIQLKLLDGEVRSELERFQNYGFTSVPKTGSEAAVIFVNGTRDHGLVLAVDDRRYRLKPLSAGEVAIYTDEGDKIHLKRNNNIEIETKTLTVKADTKARFETPILECTGHIIDNCETNTHNMGGMREIFNTHKHEENPNLSGLTEVPNQLMDQK